MPKVKFLREKTEIEVPEGANLRTEGRKHGIRFYRFPEWLNCRGLGSCGRCHVHIKNGTMGGASPAGFKERLRLWGSFFAIGHEEEVRLACQTKVTGDIEVETCPPLNLSGEWNR